VTNYTMSVILDRPYAEVVPMVRDSLAEQGFGVLAEIDVRATLQAKLGLEVPEQVILGACRPELAHRALRAAPSVAALLPCNVSVRSVDGETLVETIDPEVMSNLEDTAEVRAVATEAHARLSAALQTLAHKAEGN
jgi:uncharacterized protein (DUF302 family)